MAEFYDEVKPRKTGRPQKILNENGKTTIEKLASIMCTDEEIASVLEMSVDTLLNNNNKEAFLEHKEIGQAKGKMSLRRMQWASANKGNATMQIWLGKQYLGQTEKQETSIVDSNISFEIMPASSK